MRANVLPPTSLTTTPARAPVYILAPENNPDDGAAGPVRLERPKGAPEDLPYKVELWDEAGKTATRVLAVTSSASIGYAAYYAATREYPDHQVTLRHKNRIVARSHQPQH